jgi:battenin
MRLLQRTRDFNICLKVSDSKETMNLLLTYLPSLLSTPSGRIKHPRMRLAASFFLFGVLNNILYVIILSAALDLVPASTPKGLVAFFNIFPSLIAKLSWPYITSGAVRYKRRILVCTAASWTGIQHQYAFSALVWPRSPRDLVK